MTVENAPRLPTIDVVMMTDVGVVRDHNEDSAHVDPQGQFFIVADGMGGHAAGEIASAMAVEMVRRTLDAARERIAGFAADPSEARRREIAQLMQDAVLAAHQSVFQRGNREMDKQGMGTTLDVVLIAGTEAFVAHVGDSRTYLLRGGRASQITTDHTVAQVAVIEGRISVEEALVSPWRTVLVNAIGVSADVGVEMANLQLQDGDRLLVCSDGLHDYFVADDEVAANLCAGDLKPQLTRMIDLAKERGGHDNITGIALQVTKLVRVEPRTTGDEVTSNDGVPAAVDAGAQEATSPMNLAANTSEVLAPTEQMTAVAPVSENTGPTIDETASARDDGKHAVATELAEQPTLPDAAAHANEELGLAAAADGGLTATRATEPGTAPSASGGTVSRTADTASDA